VAEAIAYALGRWALRRRPPNRPCSKAWPVRKRSVALSCAWALSEVCPASAEIAAKSVPVLISGLKAPKRSSPGGRRDAGQLGGESQPAAPALEKALTDKNKSVREAAAKALKSDRRLDSSGREIALRDSRQFSPGTCAGRRDARHKCRG